MLAIRKAVREKAIAGRKERVARERHERMQRQQTEMCRRVAIGQSLISVCNEDKAMPTYATALNWLHDYPDFADMYKNAQRARADALFEETLTIADDGRNDWMQRNDPENPGWVANGEHLARSRLRVDTRKWAASKLNPNRYGDKLAVEGDPDKPVVVAVTHRIVHVTRQETLAAPEPERQKSDWDD